MVGAAGFEASRCRSDRLLDNPGTRDHLSEFPAGVSVVSPEFYGGGGSHEGGQLGVLRCTSRRRWWPSRQGCPGRVIDLGCRRGLIHHAFIKDPFLGTRSPVLCSVLAASTGLRFPRRPSLAKDLHDIANCRWSRSAISFVGLRCMISVTSHSSPSCAAGLIFISASTKNVSGSSVKKHRPHLPLGLRGGRRLTRFHQNGPVVNAHYRTTGPHLRSAPEAWAKTPGTRPVYHAVSPYCRMALCSVEPGGGSGWAEPPAAEVTCPKCRERLERL